MIGIINQETLLHISFSLAAFVFSVVLYILIRALGTGQVHKNLKFRTFTISIVIGNLISILDIIFRDSGLYPTPPPIKLALLLLVYLANILLTYYMALYMEGFFEEFRLKKLFFAVNSSLVISSILVVVTVYFRQIILYEGEAVVETVPIWNRVLLGYVYELYFLLYVVAIFVIFRKTLSRRARWTSMSAFSVAIGGVLLELLNTFGITDGILFNYFGAVLALYIFYIGVETPDYQNLLSSMEELKAARKAADDANRSKSDFLANMSHEIRTPINTVLGMNEMILREAEDDTILTYAENIRNAGTVLLGLINDVLDFSKIDAGKIEILPVEYDLSEVIRGLVNMIAIRADEKGLLLELDFDRDIPKHLYGDEVRVRQVITNILTNAVKYTRKGSIAFIIKYEICTDDPDSIMLNVAVRDTGIGIKSEDLPKLFSEFERIEEKRNRNIEGTGLGLSITKSLLELMGSSLQVESIYGEGSTFSFSLRQKVTDWEKLGDYEHYNNEDLGHRKYRTKFTAPHARVLVVDDNRMNLMVFKNLIKQTLVTVDTAGSGDEGLQLAAMNPYDIIFLDHMMPKKDGIETLHELKEKTDGPNSNIPVICLTANALSGARDHYKAEGFEDYLSKPLDSSELEDMLMHYLPKEKLMDADQKSEYGSEEAGGSLGEGLSALRAFGIDAESGIKNCGTLKEYLPVLKVFYESMDESSEELEEYYIKEAYEDYTVRIHSLKSSARIIGDFELGEMAQKLEDAGKAKDGLYIREHHKAFMDEYMRLKTPLSALFADKTPDETMPEADAKMMESVYEEIKEAAGAMDISRLEEILERMEGYTLPEAEAERWKKIRLAFDQFEYEDILRNIPDSPE